MVPGTPLPPPPFCMSEKATTYWDRSLNEIAKSKVPCHSKYGTIKIPPLSKTVVTKYRPFCSFISKQVGDFFISEQSVILNVIIAFKKGPPSNALQKGVIDRTTATLKGVVP